MKKVFLQDVVPAGKRSIRNIPLPTSKSNPLGATLDAVSVESSTSRSQKAPPQKPVRREKSKSRFSNPGIWTLAALVLLVLGYASSFLFVSATVDITPKEVNTSVAISGAASITPAEGGLGFTVVTLTREASKDIPSTGEEKVSRKATGKIVIYNDFSKDPQKLIANTRFETTDGLIFRITEAVTVPGQKVVGGAVTPGSLAVTVTADQAGEKYNIGLADFTIPGFKGDPRFAKITAKSDPKFPMKGGLIGTVQKISPSDLAAAKISIETQLKNKLREDLEAQIPESHILFNNAYTFDFEDVQTTENTAVGAPAGTAANATVTEKGSIYGILFDRKELSQYIAARSAGAQSASEKDVFVPNLDSLALTIDNKEAFNQATTKEITFKLAGAARFVWNLDQAQIKQSLVGQKRANIKAILANFESIDRANVVISPVWIFTMPRKTDKIHIETVATE